MDRIADTRKALTATVLVTILFVGLMGTPASAATDLERQMLRATNASRERHDVPRLRLDRQSTSKAHRHSAAMAANGEIFHTADPADFYLRGVRWSKWGENVGRTAGELVGLQDAFMNSQVHRDNILDRRFKKVGIGVVRRDGTSWVTLFFFG
jgi:uncharacterized protein YkwD